MGLRFRKSIKICKGLKVNLSTSGASVTIGGKGVSLNVGKRGTFINASIPKTGLSYREKLDFDMFKGLTSGDKATSDEIEAVEKYEAAQEFILNIHKYADNVVNKYAFENKLNSTFDENKRALLAKIINGDQEIIEALISQVNENLSLPYEANISFELNNDTLYVDLDLPDDWKFEATYPSLTLSKTLLMKTKNQTQMRQEYARLVEALPIYLAANYFNVSCFISEVVISAFVQKRDNVGELVDNYIYSIKFSRQTFENTDLSKVNDPYEFILRFPNRINVSTSGTFKPIIPYGNGETEAETQTNPLIEEAIEGLKSLGYKQAEINRVLPHLQKLTFETSDKYLKEALLLLLKKNSLDTL